MPNPAMLDFSESVLLLRELGFGAGVVRSPRSPAAARVVLRTRDLHIGFDLGTSCSKVMIGDPEAGKSFAVCFNDGVSGIARYLVPTRFECADDRVSIGGPRSQASVTDLKWDAIETIAQGRDAHQSAESLASYIALVLRRVLEWYDRELSGRYVNSSVEWHLNIGFPDKRVDGPLLLLYERAARAAVTAAWEGKAMSRSGIAELLSIDGAPFTASRAAPVRRIHFFPEIAAQLAGYVKSPYRRVGNLLLVDVGAGTLDVSTLIIHRWEDAVRCSFHYCDVQPLGAFHLFDERGNALEVAWPGSVKSFDPALGDGLAPIPDSLAEFVTDQQALPWEAKRAFFQTSEDFARRCRSVCLNILRAFGQALKDVHDNSG